MSPEAILADLGNADARGMSAKWFPPNGEFVVDLEDFKVQLSTDPAKKGHTIVVIEAKVAWTSTPAVLVGNVYSQTFDLNKYGLPDLKVFFTALHGKVPSDQAFAEMLQAGFFVPQYVIQVANSKTCQGRPVRGQRMLLITKLNKKGSFTKHGWRPAPQ